MILARLGSDPHHAERERQLASYAGLEKAQKEALLADLAANQQTLLTTLQHCYEIDADEALKIRLYALMSLELSKSQCITLADQAASRGQSRLLQRIVDSLRNPG